MGVGISCVCVSKLCVSKLCMCKLCVNKLSVRGGDGGPQPKARSPHKDVGENKSVVECEVMSISNQENPF